MAFSQAKVAWVLLEQGRIEVVAEESARNAVRQRSPVTLAITHCALTVSGEFVICLAQTRLHANHPQGDGIDCRLRKQVKLLPRSQRWSILTASNRELR